MHKPSTAVPLSSPLSPADFFLCVKDGVDEMIKSSPTSPPSGSTSSSSTPRRPCPLLDTSLALFRVMASLGRNMIVANTFGSFALLVVMILGGFIITKESIPVWWIWGYWVSPMMYEQNAISVNEFHGHSWSKQFADQNITLGEAILTGYGLFKEKYWFWIGVGALFGYAIVLNVLFALFLTLLNPIGNMQAVVSKDEIRHKDSSRKNDRVALVLRSYLHSTSLNALNLKEQKGISDVCLSQI